MAIEHATIRADTWTTINAQLAILYPTLSIYSMFPDDFTKKTFSDFPFVVQEMANVTIKQKKFGKNPPVKEVTTLVEIYDKNPATIDTYADNIANRFETVNIDGVKDPIVNDSDEGQLQVNGRNVSFKILAITFTRV